MSQRRVWWYLCVLWSLWRGERHQTQVIQRFYDWLNISNVHCQQQHQHWKLITFQRRAPKWIWKQFLPKLAIDHHCTSSTQGMRVESWARTRPARRGWNFKQANCLPNIGQYNSQFFSLYLPTIRRSVSPIPRWSPPNCRDQFCRSPLTHSASIRRKKGRKKLPHFGLDSWGFGAWLGL